MRLCTVIVAAVALVLPTFAADQSLTQPGLCSTQSGPEGCGVSKKDLKEAKQAFERGLKLQKNGKPEAALEHFERASQLIPRHVEYATARELARQTMVYQLVQKGNAHQLAGDRKQALKEYRAALKLDPDNQFTQQQVGNAAAPELPSRRGPVRIVEDAPQIRLQPQEKLQDFHYRGDTRGLITQVAAAYGITAILDDSVLSRPARFNVEKVDFWTAMDLVSTMTKSFWSPLAARQMLVANNTPDNRRQFERMSLRTFLIPGANAAKELTDIVNVLRNMFDMRFVSQSAAAGTITVRGPQKLVDAATQFLENLDSGQPQVILEVQVYQIDRSVTRDWGLDVPTQFSLFNIPASALSALAGRNIQDLINQLISSGGINQANSSAIQGLLAQLQNQQNSIFSQPLATFGNGQTLFGLSLGTLAARLSLNQSQVKTLEHATLRAGQGNQATMLIGSRYPILNATFAPIFNTPAISQAIGNNSFRPAFPSFNYEDIGVNLKAKPIIHGNSDVSLDLELQVRALSGAQVNGVPVISNREYKGSITLKDGQPAVVAGSISSSEQRSIHGLPGFGSIYALNNLTAANNRQDTEDELLVVITPHVVRRIEPSDNEIWVSAGN
jgi:type II secretory pathway component GspD/PulD (secretin)